MVAIRSITPKNANTWADYTNSLLQFVTPPGSFSPKAVIIVMDTYADGRIEGNTQSTRGDPGRKIWVTGGNQLTPTGKDWESFSIHYSWYAEFRATYKAVRFAMLCMETILPANYFRCFTSWKRLGNSGQVIKSCLVWWISTSSYSEKKYWLPSWQWVWSNWKH